MSNGINVQLVFKDNSADDESMTMMALLKFSGLFTLSLGDNWN